MGRIRLTPKKKYMGKDKDSSSDLQKFIKKWKIEPSLVY